MPVPSLVSLGVTMSLLVAPTVLPVDASSDDTASGSGTGTITQVLPLTTSSGETTDVATGALDFSETGNGGSAVSPMRQGILSTTSDSDWTDDSAILTQPLEVDPFMVTALTWDGGALAEEMQIYLRVKEQTGWSEWYAVDSDTGTGPDDAIGTSGTDPFVTGGADGIQVRVSGDASELPTGLALQLIPSDPEGQVEIDEDDVDITSAAPTELNEASLQDAATDTATGTSESSSRDTGVSTSEIADTSQSSGSSQSGGSSAGAGVGTGESAIGSLSAVFPASTTANGLPVSVSSRADWGADESYMTWTPKYASASHVIVHHTAGTNTYTMDESASVVRGIYYYHAVTLGWGDIGYNFLVDKWGRAYEGRSGSLAAAAGEMAVGAHDQGFNTGTMGISMMGNYSSVTPSQATLDTVGKLAAWQLKRAGVDPTGSAEFVNVGGNAKYPAGSHINLPRISGHRDTYYTDCPGNAGYAQLPTIRKIAASAVINVAPIGFLDRVSVGAGNSVDIVGWAYDADTTSSVSVDLSVDGIYAGRIIADKTRTDVKNALGIRAEVGYVTTIATTSGSHTVCARAINQPSGENPRLGCKTLTVEHDPQGHLDKVAPEKSGKIRVIGWAYDADTTSPVSVTITVDGQVATTAEAILQRSDVSSLLGIRANVGYSALVSATEGTHTVCATAINIGQGKNQSQECRTVTLNTTPIGFLDKVTVNASGSVDVVGWAYDVDTDSALQVDLSVDGEFWRSMTADQTRSDVQKILGIRATVGYSTTLQLTPGNHTVCTRAHNVPSGDNPRLGCRDVTVSNGFNAGTIISDSKMFTSNTMNPTQIQLFLTEKNPNCVESAAGVSCLKDFTETTTAMSATYCKTYEPGSNESASTIISKASAACGINPQVILVMLQKEQGLVLASADKLSATKYAQALGFRMSNANYASFAAQVYFAAGALVEYGERPYAFSYRSGQTAQISYNPNPACGSSTVTITNRATAALFNYTPYQPNAAALADMHGSGDSCSSFGNRNFWRYFTEWFGSTV